MENAKQKSAEVKDDAVKHNATVGVSKTEAGGVNQKSKKETSLDTEQDLDVFLLGDLGDSDNGPGIPLAPKKRKREIFKISFGKCNCQSKCCIRFCHILV
ncbi:hypothetical protein LguiA_009391 [Lonicera macranthoides]